MMRVHRGGSSTPVIGVDPASSPHCRAAYDVSQESYGDGVAIDSLTDRSGNGLTISASATERPLMQTNVLNGRAVAEYDGSNDRLAAASAADWKFLHDGHAICIIALVQARDLNPEVWCPIVDTNAAGTEANTGISFGIDDAGAVEQGTYFSITKGGGAGTSVVSLTSSNNVLNMAAWNVLVVRYAGRANALENYGADFSDARVYVNGVVASAGNADTADYPHATGNPTAALRVGYDGTTSAKINLAGLWLFDTELADDVLDTYLKYIADRWGVGVAHTVVPSHADEAFSKITRLNSGALMLAWRRGAQHETTTGQGVIMRRISRDNGWTWDPTSEALVLEESSYGVGPGCLFKTSAGTLLMSTFETTSTGPDYRTRILRSTNDGISWTTITPTTGFTDWDFADGDMCQMDDGDLVLPVYGLLSGGTFTSSKVLRSADDGQTWSAVMVANGPGSSKNWNEMSLIKTGANAIRAMIRNETDGRFDTATSSDGGETWGAVSSSITGVTARPSVLKLASGTVLITYRPTSGNRRGQLKWSSDNGATWSATTYYLDPIDGFNEYATMWEVASGLVLIVHSSLPGAQTLSTEPAMSWLRAQIHREADILLFT